MNKIRIVFFLFFLSCFSAFGQWVTSGTANTANVYTGGKVGIFTSTPNGYLQFGNQFSNRKIVFYENPGTNNEFQFFGMGMGSVGTRFSIDGTTSNFGFFAGLTNTTEKELMRITGTGYVGIGTSSPLSGLHVHSATANAHLQLSGTGPGLMFSYNGTGTDNGGIGFPSVAGQYVTNSAINDMVVRTTTASNILFATNTTERLRITSTGNVGIGTSSVPTGFKLAVQGNEYVSGNLGIGTSTIPSGFNLAVQGSEYISGNLGIGTSTTASGYVANVLGNATLNGRIQINNSTNTTPDNTVAGLNISNTTTGTSYSWLQTNASLPLALNPAANSSYIAIGFTPGSKTIPTACKLAVNGNILCNELKVKLYANWPDYVFSKNYSLMSLDSVAAYIDKNQHLPEVPSAREVEENGINTGEMNSVLLKKIEELTLYMIEQKKEMEMQKKEIDALKMENQKLNDRMSEVTR